MRWMTDRNYVLIGFMGAGKTTIGRVLSRRLRLDFKDTDALIESKTGYTISDIFAKYGEDHFRELETEIIAQLAESLSNTVLSAGGGLPINKNNHSYLKKIGKVVYLRVSSETVRRRLQNDTTRPLLRGSAAEVNERIEHLLKERDPIYKALADKVIQVDALSVAEIVSRIIAE